MRHLGGSIRAAALAVAVLVASFDPRPAEAAPIRLGFTGAHALPQSVWDDMDRDARVAFVAHRAELAARLGARVLRLGDVTPTLVTWDDVAGDGTHRDWRFVDEVIGAHARQGVEVCLTVPDLLGGISSSVARSFVAALAERYDGDVDFGVAPARRNHEFPNIDGSEWITEDDWEAGEAELQAWADGHRIAVIEAGDEPRRMERTGQLDVGAYGTLLMAARAGLGDAGSDQRLMLAGVAIEEQSKAHFTDRLAALSAGDGPWFDAANVHLFGSAGDPTQATAVAQVRKLGDWLSAVGHPDAERWIGEVALGADPRDEGPCTDPRCSERMRAGGLVRLVVASAAAGVSVVLYAEPIEVVGPGVEEGPRAGTGLLTMELQGSLDPSSLPVEARPSWAVWRRLGDLLEGVDTADVRPVAGLPVNVHGFRVADAGWIAWHDWTSAVGPGEPYDETPRELTLEGVASPSVRVVTLWPEDVGDTPDDEGRVPATWPQEIVPVHDGEATVTVGQDPVWIEPRDEVIVPDEGSEADAAPDAAGGDVAPEADEGGGSGCGLGGSPPAWPLLTLAGALMGAAVVRRRRRRPQVDAR